MSAPLTVAADSCDLAAAEPCFLGAASEEPPPAGPLVVATGGPAFLADIWDVQRTRVEPWLLRVVGGKPLLYEGESHSIYGEGGSGKTWVGLVAARDVARSGRIALILDYESNVDTTVSRLKELGTTRDEASRIAYWAVDDSLMPATPLGGRFWGWVDAHGPAFVLIDSVARALATAGFDENKNSDYNLWDAGVVAKLVRRRITVLTIDHTGHQSGGRTNAAKAIGASSKANRQSGAAYYFEVVRPWTRTSNGIARLTCMKDREGHRSRGEVAAEMHVTVGAGDEQVHVEFRAPARSGSGMTVRDEYKVAIRAVLAERHEPMSMNAVNTALEQRGLLSGKRLLTQLVPELEQAGQVRVEPGRNRAKMVSLVSSSPDKQVELHPAARVEIPF